jgi:hypothetical protein
LSFPVAIFFFLIGSLAAVASDQVVPAQKQEEGPETPITPVTPDRSRTELNLLGQTDTKAGESRRNENVQFNLVDNNAQKELNIRIGTTATIVTQFDPVRNYFGAEYGAPPTVPAHVNGLRGSGVHGMAWFGHLNSVFTARSFFQVGPVRPAHENDYGFALLIPLWKGVRWQVDGSQRKIRGQVNGNILIPLPEERTPLVAGAEERAFIQRILDAYPKELPNRPDIDPRMLNTNAPQVIDSDFFHSRMDQELPGDSRLVADYQFTLQNVDAFQLIKGQNPDTTTRSHKARLTWIKTLSHSRLLEATVGFDRVGSLLVPEPNSPGSHVLIGGLTSINGSTMIPVNRAQNDFRYAVRYRQESGSHQWTIGAEVVRRQLNGYDSDNHMELGTYSFRNNFGNDAITNLRLGRPTTYWKSIGLIHRGFRNWDMAAYAGDRWSVNGTLTVDYGLRWRGLTRPTEVNNLTQLPYASDWNNFGPSVGLAVRLPGNWGVWRTAGAVHFGEIFPATYQQARFNQPYNTKNIVNDPPLLNPLSALGPGPRRGVLYDFAPDLRLPYVVQYNASWELQPARDWTVQLGYVGSRGVKLLTHWYFNRPQWPEGVVPSTGEINDRRPDPQYLDKRYLLNGSKSWFDAARVSVTSRSWKGLSFEASYWFSKSIDLGGDYTNTAYDTDSFRNVSQVEQGIHADVRARSRFDQPHAFLSRQSYQIPWFTSSPKVLRRAFSGWTVSGVVLLKSGTPFTVGTGSDAPGYGNVDGISGDRPNLLDPSILGRTIGDPDTSRERLPRSAFAYLRPGERAGNLGRYTFRRGGIYNVNASLSRSFTLPREARLVFRIESINFLNTPQFAEPGFNMADPNFGAITNTLNEGRNFRFHLSVSL